jgi:hypothetical protein
MGAISETFDLLPQMPEPRLEPVRPLRRLRREVPLGGRADSSPVVQYDIKELDPRRVVPIQPPIAQEIDGKVKGVTVDLIQVTQWEVGLLAYRGDQLRKHVG